MIETGKGNLPRNKWLSKKKIVIKKIEYLAFKGSQVGRKF